MSQMSNFPLVSIVTPSYNQAEFIEETLNSVDAQNYAKIEHIVQDGGSDDGTLDVLREYDCNWVSESDKGQADAINRAFERANGEIIGWLNSDDVYFTNDVVENVVALFEQTDVDVIYGDYALIDRQSIILAVRCLPDFDFKRLLRGCFIAQPSVFFRSDILEEHRLNPDLEYGMDYEFWLRLAKAGYNFNHISSVLSGDRNYSDRKIRRDATKLASENQSLQQKFGRSYGSQYYIQRMHDIVFSGIPRRICGSTRGVRLAFKDPELAFDGSFSQPATIFRNTFRGNQVLV